MRRKYENRFAMVESTVAVLNENKNVWEKTPAFVKAVADLASSMQSIQTESGKQQTPTKGATASKAQARDAVEDVVLEIADQLSALAEERGDVELAAQVEITRSALDKVSDEELENTTKRVAVLATQNIGPLADYLVSQEDIAELTKLQGEFSSLKTAPRVAVVERSNSTASLPERLSDASRILRCRIDKMVSKYRNTSPEFVAKYRSARVIVDRGGTTKSKEPKPPAPVQAK
jgi:hypothetical protein